MSSEVNLTTLMHAHDILSRRIAWIVFLRLLVLLSLVAGLYVGFARALNRVDVADLDATRDATRALVANVARGDAPEFDRANDPLGFREGEYDAAGALRPSPDGSAARQPIPLTKDQKDKLFVAVSGKRHRIEQIYDRAFVSQHELVVQTVDFDIRQWPIAVPPLLIGLIFIQVYLHILCKKRQLLALVGTRWVSLAAPGTSVCERLIFSSHEKTADGFRLHPARFVRWLNICACIGLLIGISPFVALSTSSSDDLFPLLGLVGAIGLYAVVYGRYVSGRLERQTEGILKCQLDPTWVACGWATGTRWARSFMVWLKPRLSLGAGSALLLLSLFLVVGMKGCSDCRGYEIVLGRGHWWSADDLNNNWFSPILGPVTRAVYLLSIVLAIVSVVLWLVSLRRPGALQNRRALFVLSVLSGTVSFFALGDFSVLPLASLAPTGAPWILGWLAPLSLWLCFGFWQKRAKHERWLRIRSSLVVLLVPLAVLGTVTLSVAVEFRFDGLVMFYLGAHLLALGYLKLAAQAQEVARARAAQP